MASGTPAAAASTVPEAYQPGAVWWVQSWVLSGPDKKPDRPVVLVQSERYGLGFVVAWARTSDTDAPGILTPKDVVPGLNSKGVVSPRFQHQIELSRLREPFGRFLGVLPEPYLSQVVAAWEGGL